MAFDATRASMAYSAMVLRAYRYPVASAAAGVEITGQLCRMQRSVSHASFLGSCCAMVSLMILSIFGCFLLRPAAEYLLRKRCT